MQFKAAILATLALLSSALAQSVSVSYDQTYDNASGSLSTVACSNGPNGLETKGFTTFESLPDFPMIGGAPAVAGWNSPACGTCWELTYEGTSIIVLAVDHSGDGFNLSLEAMNKLTNGQATFLGRVTATSRQLTSTQCGL
ncbi:Cerato-platanin [Obba rivulosa]|uniref:Cerato-platanin n=1 Tax=Obba rivulosa TaxID=1052685 RepID=A0A8E2DV18_9APHY|nr:Cerato-platanin [Obba rivulosa]